MIGRLEADVDFLSRRLVMTLCGATHDRDLCRGIIAAAYGMEEDVVAWMNGVASGCNNPFGEELRLLANLPDHRNPQPRGEEAGDVPTEPGFWCIKWEGRWTPGEVYWGHTTALEVAWMGWTGGEGLRMHRARVTWGEIEFGRPIDVGPAAMEAHLVAIGPYARDGGGS